MKYLRAFPPGINPEELAEEIGKFLDEEPPEYRNRIPHELQVELRKPRSRDDLVTFLKEKLNSMPKRTGLLLAAAKGEGVAAFQGVAAPKVETKQESSTNLIGYTFPNG